MTQFFQSIFLNDKTPRKALRRSAKSCLKKNGNHLSSETIIKQKLSQWNLYNQYMELAVKFVNPLIGSEWKNIHWKIPVLRRTGWRLHTCHRTQRFGSTPPPHGCVLSLSVSITIHRNNLKKYGILQNNFTRCQCKIEFNINSKHL